MALVPFCLLVHAFSGPLPVAPPRLPVPPSTRAAQDQITAIEPITATLVGITAFTGYLSFQSLQDTENARELLRKQQDKTLRELEDAAADQRLKLTFSTLAFGAALAATLEFGGDFGGHEPTAWSDST